MSTQERTDISREELFRLCCCAFDEVISMDEYHNEVCKDALTIFSRKLENKMFAAPADRYYTPTRVKAVVKDVLSKRSFAAAASRTASAE